MHAVPKSPQIADAEAVRRRRNDLASVVFQGQMRRALNIAIVIAFVVASVAAQAIDLTPVALLLLVAAVFSMAPLFSPAIDA
jgi:hypothetical protein